MSDQVKYRGTRTGVVITTQPPNNNGEMEDPSILFDAAKTPSPAREQSSITKKKKPALSVRFSNLPEDSQDLQQDDCVNNELKHKQAVRDYYLKIRRSSSDSINTADLSSVSTAPPSSTKRFEEHEEHDEDAMENETEHFEEKVEEHVVNEEQGISSPDNFPMPDDSHPSDDEQIPDEQVPDEQVPDEDDLAPSPPHQYPEQEDDEIIAQNQPSEEDNNSTPKVAAKIPGSDLSAKTSPDEGFPVDEGEVEYSEKEETGEAGFDMQGNESDDSTIEPETPEDIRKKRYREETRMKELEKSKKRKESSSARSKKSKKKKQKRQAPESESEDESDPETPVAEPTKKKKTFNKFATTFTPKGVPQPRTFTHVPVTNLKSQSPNNNNLRRSTRMRTAPLEFWRGEKYEYGANDFGAEYEGVRNMPIVKGIARANPTPYKPRKKPKSRADPKKKKAGKNKSADNYESDDSEPFDSKSLRKKLNINKGNKAQLWDEVHQETREMMALSYFSKMEHHDLPVLKTRKKSESKIVGCAAQAFNVDNENAAFPGYIVGSLVIPPKGIKDAESVGLCSQVFTVVKAHGDSVEVAYGNPDDDVADWDPRLAQRFLASQGDNFVVPPGNTYRIQNHSDKKKCVLSWTIIRHNDKLVEHDDDP